MSSQAAFGSNTLFQSINDDLTASLNVADELSKEFNSLMKEASTGNNNPTSGSQTSSNISKSRSQSSGPSSLSSSMWSSGSSTNGSSSSKAASSGLMSFNDSGVSSSRNAPSPPVSSNSPHSSPSTPRAASHTHRRSGSDSFNFSPQSPKQPGPSPRPGSPSYFERSPQGTITYRERTSSPSRTSLDPLSCTPSLQTAFNPMTASDNQMGLRSPRHDKGPSPLSFKNPAHFSLGQPSYNSLPRNLHASMQTDEGLKRQKHPGKWNETDLDMSYERKPHHTYDKTEWLRTSGPNTNWRESNLDGPLPASGPKKDHRLMPQQGSYSSLPRNIHMSVPPELSSQGHFHRDMKTSPYYSQPISRISIPPSSPRSRRQKPMPLSVILRLQNPYFGGMTHLPHALEGERSVAAFYSPVPVPREFSKHAFQPQQQQPPELRQPAVYSDALRSGDVDAEIERLNVVPPAPATLENPAAPGGGGEVEQAVAPAPRPLSPTRLQPVVAPEAQSNEIPDREELLRIRAEIPRPLKRRGSVDASQPLKNALHYQPNQYKNLIDKLFHRKDHRPKGERGSDSSSSSDEEDSAMPPVPKPAPQTSTEVPQDVKSYNSILRQARRDRKTPGRRARLSPLVLMLDGALMGELETVKKAVQEMTDPSQPNDEGITGLHNAICGGHYDVVDLLVRIGANVSAPDSHGWTPLHCAASCNDRVLCEFLVRNGAAVMAVTESDSATASQKCDPYLAGFEECESYLRGMEEAMGVENSGVLYALWSYQAQAADELNFRDGDMITILQKPEASDWWWASLCGREGFVPNNYFGLFPKVRPKSLC